jgi:hypothetical protein
MKFDLLRHEEETIEFYKKLIAETDDIELKKQLLKHHFDFLVSLHALEKEFRAAVMSHEQALDKNDLEHEKLRRESRRVSRET